MRKEGLEQPQSVEDAINQYREESDTIGIFIRECITEARMYKTLIKDVYEEYEEWCSENGYNPLNNRNLISELRRKGLTVKASTGNKSYLFDCRLVSGGRAEITEEGYASMNPDGSPEFDFSDFD